MLQAWDSLERENFGLKIFVIILFVTSTVLGITAMLETQKPPLVIERGCVSQVSNLGKSAPSDDEVKIFIELALHARFDSKPHDPSFMTLDQKNFRAIEQKDLEGQKMRQAILVNSIEIKEGTILADCDRLIAVGNVRSTFRFPLRVDFDVTTRSSANPYGLLLKRAEPITTEVKK